MFVRVMSAVAAVVVVAVFLLPSTIAIYAAVNGTAWNLQDVHSFVSPFLTLAIAAFTLVLCPVRRTLLPQSDVTHPIVHIPLFELDCALLR